MGVLECAPTDDVRNCKYLTNFHVSIYVCFFVDKMLRWGVVCTMREGGEAAGPSNQIRANLPIASVYIKVHESGLPNCAPPGSGPQ